MNHERIYATIVDHLAKRYSECFSREEVEEVVLASREQLAHDARHPEFLPALVGHDAHDRLLARARADCREARPVPDILFVCEHNEARSQMAAAIAQGLAPGHVHVRSAGAHPTHRLNPAVVQALREYGLELDRLYPSGTPHDVTDAADVVVQMGCEVPELPGRRYVDWEVHDPHGETLEEVRVCRDLLYDRVRALLEDLEVPLDGPLADRGRDPDGSAADAAYDRVG